MKINSTLLLSIFIFLAASGVVSASAIISYKFGTKSLEVVKSPLENPAQKLTNKDSSSSESNQGFQIIEEKKILVEVYDYVFHQKKANKEKKNSIQQSAKANVKFITNKSSQNPWAKINLPLKGESQRVKMEITQIKEQQGSLLLNVNLQNNGSQSVKFLYSFLEVKDDKNRSLSAIADGLPTKLPANGKIFSGRIRIPLSLLNDSKKIFLTLPDYPNQQLSLKIPGIPIVKVNN